MNPDNSAARTRTCAWCASLAELVTPEGTLCNGHAFAMAGYNGDWIPLIRKVATLEGDSEPAEQGS